MKNIFLRILSLALACLMTVPFLFACENEDNIDESKDPYESTYNELNQESEETKDPTKADLPDIMWDGELFNVLGMQSTENIQFQNFEIVYDEENLGEGVNDAIFKRNSKLEEQYDVKITQTLLGGISAALAEQSVSGDKLYDLVFQTINDIGTNALEGYFFDLNSMKYIDFTKPYWNPRVNEAVSFADKVYFTSSDFSLRDKSRAYIMFYNPEIMAEHNIPDIISTVKQGKWTLDVMTEYADLVDADLTGEGERNIYEDKYGYVVCSGTSFATLMYAADNRIIDRNEDKELTLVMNNEHTINSIDKILKLYANKNVVYESGESDWYASAKCWYAGRALFAEAFPHSFKTSTENCEFDFGVIPFPKYDEAQDNYYTMPDLLAMLFAIPASCKNPEFSGFMIEALSSESTDTSLYAYYEVACKTRYSYSPINGEMLDLIFEGIRYDTAMIYSIGGLFDIISEVIPESGQNLFSSVYKRKESRALKEITEIKDTLSALPY